MVAPTEDSAMSPMLSPRTAAVARASRPEASPSLGTLLSKTLRFLESGERRKVNISDCVKTDSSKMIYQLMFDNVLNLEKLSFVEEILEHILYHKLESIEHICFKKLGTEVVHEMN